MKMTMLTYDTLKKFQSLVDIKTLTPEQISEIEHDAYCANMGASSKEAAYERFSELVKEYVGIDLRALEKQAEKGNAELKKKGRDER